MEDDSLRAFNVETGRSAQRWDPMISNDLLGGRLRDPLNIDGALAEMVVSERKNSSRVVRLKSRFSPRYDSAWNK